MNENLTYNDLIQNEVNMQPKLSSVDANIMHKNKLVKINPYKQKNCFLGKSQLKQIIREFKSNIYVSIFLHLLFL